MSLHGALDRELTDLFDALCDERIDASQFARLEARLRDDASARQLYVEYMLLHGQLSWDTAQGVALADERVPGSEGVASPLRLDSMLDEERAAPATLTKVESGRFLKRPRTWWMALSAVSVAAMLLVGVLLTWRAAPSEPHAETVAETAPAHGSEEMVGSASTSPVGAGSASTSPVGAGSASTSPMGKSPRERTSGGPIEVASGGFRDPASTGSIVKTAASHPVAKGGSVVPSVAATPRDRNPLEGAAAGSGGSSDATIISFIDARIRDGWRDARVEPSKAASDGEWLRRVSLDLVGHIPPYEETVAFLKDKSANKRERVIARLLDSPSYARNWSTIWSNLLVGRAPSDDNTRPPLQRFLREAFARNRPWSEVVSELVAAEGTADENGAAGFLLAHLNNEAVPATAITSRLLLGVQVHCTQCHDHPSNAGWKQNQFWELNSFFHQTARVDLPRTDSRTGKQVMRAALVSKEVGGPTYFETRTSLLRAAYPRFNGRQVSAEPSTNRRHELARLMIEGNESQVARAAVNRVWAHFLGRGFVHPIDDMGPHNPPSHPQLLDRLTEEFVRCGYDLKQLMRWICLSDAYQRSSRFEESNRIDDPSAGEQPLFSRVYPKPMSAEQLYDSLLVATRAHYAAGSSWDAVERQRRDWLQQFVMALGTEENDEANTFDGSIPQALLLMNSSLTEKATSPTSGTFFHEVLVGRGSEAEKLQRLSLSALSRVPTPAELAEFKRMLRQRQLARPSARAAVVTECLQDVFWAYLNSGEFIFVH